jgi:hypothetical protein
MIREQHHPATKQRASQIQIEATQPSIQNNRSFGKHIGNPSNDHRIYRFVRQ